MKITNYIIAHKHFECPKIMSYIPLQVGYGKDLGYLRDNIGDNISEKNRNYCELTGLYWIWKNDKSSDYIGINHYRRYFKSKKFKNDYSSILKESQILEILQTVDVILPKKEIYKESVKEQYCRNSGYEKDLKSVRDIINQKYPQYLLAFDETLNGKRLSQFNMMICKKTLFNEYCSWLFDILFELEKTVDLTGYNDYQKRIYGFLSERLLNVWIKYKKVSVKEIDVINFDMTLKQRTRVQLRRVKNFILGKIN